MFLCDAQAAHRSKEMAESYLKNAGKSKASSSKRRHGGPVIDVTSDDEHPVKKSCKPTIKQYLADDRWKKASALCASTVAQPLHKLY
jgi:hypothetical protein